MARMLPARRRRLPSLVLLLLALLCLAEPAGAAAPSLTWSAPQLVDHKPPYAVSEKIDGLACPAVDLCVALGDGGNVATSRTPADPASWSLPKLLAASPDQALACASTTLCVVAASDGHAYATHDPGAASPTWKSTSFPAPLFPRALSCPSASLCVGVDTVGQAFTSTNPGAASPTWTIHPALVLANPTAISCASADLCAMANQAGDVRVTTNPGAASPTWSAATIVTAAGAAITGLSCPTTTFCAAVDANGNAYTTSAPTTPPWSAATAVSAPLALRDVTCVAAGACVAVSDKQTFATTTASGPAPVWTAKNIGGLGTRNLQRLACASTELCVAATATNGLTTASTNAFAAASAWSAASDTVGANSFMGASCPSVTLCVAVTNAGHIAVTTNPTAVAPAWRLIDAPARLSDVACPTVTRCYAADVTGRLHYTDDPAGATAWTQNGGPPVGPIVQLSCPATTLCVALTESKSIWVSTDPTNVWTGGSNVPMGAPSGISCTTSGRCAVADNAGNVHTTSDVRSQEPPTVSPKDVGAGIPLTAIACPSEARCMASDLMGSVYTSGNAFAASPTWSAPVDQDVVGLTCLSQALCIGSGDNKVRLTIDGATTWSPATTIGANDVYWQRVTCASALLCLAVDVQGRASLGVGLPVSSAAPAVSGTPEVGRTLTATAGTWDGAPSVARQWQRCDDGGCADIAGATGPAYEVARADGGKRLRVRESATNAAGTVSAHSADTTAVPALPEPSPTPTTAAPTPVATASASPGATATPAPGPAVPSTAAIKAALKPVLNVSGAAARLARLTKAGSFTVTFRAPSAGRLDVRWLSIPARRARKAVLLARGTASATSARQVLKVKVKLTPAGKKALRRVKRVKITVQATFTPKGGKAVTSRKAMTLRR